MISTNADIRSVGPSFPATIGRPTGVYFFFIFFLNTKTFIDNHKTKYKVQGRPTLKNAKKLQKVTITECITERLSTNKRCLQQLSRLLDIKIP